MDIQRVNQQSYVAPKQIEGAPRREGNTEPQVNDEVSLNNKPQEPLAPKKWTILHWTAAENNLEQYLVSDVNEMERVGSTDNMNLISMLDRPKGTQAHYLMKDNDMSKINSPVIRDYGRENAADPKFMTSFLVDMMEQYPAENFAFILGDHGAGWTGAIEDGGTHSFMSMPMIREALEDAQAQTGKKIDLVAFDACLMATGEVGHELKDVAKYMVASQEVEGGAGWPYTPLLTGTPKRNTDTPNVLQQLADDLDKRLDISPKDFATKMVTNAETYDQNSIPTLSAFDLTKSDKFADATNKFAQALLETDTPNSVFKGIVQQTQSFYYRNLKDMYHFAEHVATDPKISDDKLQKSAANMIEVLEKEYVLANQNSKKYPNAHGVSIELPNSLGSNSVGSAKYQELVYAKETLWDEAVSKFMK